MCRYAQLGRAGSNWIYETINQQKISKTQTQDKKKSTQTNFPNLQLIVSSILSTKEVKLQKDGINHQ